MHIPLVELANRQRLPLHRARDLALKAGALEVVGGRRLVNLTLLGLPDSPRATDAA